MDVMEKKSELTSAVTLDTSRHVAATLIPASQTGTTASVTKKVRSAVTKRNDGHVAMRFIPQDPTFDTRDTSY